MENDPWTYEWQDVPCNFGVDLVTDLAQCGDRFACDECEPVASCIPALPLDDEDFGMAND